MNMTLKNGDLVKYTEIILKEDGIYKTETSYPIIATKDVFNGYEDGQLLVLDREDDLKIIKTIDLDFSVYSKLNNPFTSGRSRNDLMSSYMYSTDENVVDILINSMLEHCECFNLIENAKLINKYKGAIKWVHYTN